MSLTIREALKFGGLFGATVVAGEEGLDIPIESVSVLEIADRNISHWVLKKQLYITAFYAITCTAFLFKPCFSTPALLISNLSEGKSSFAYPSAIWLRHEFPVQRK